jgi:hypothetical protein
MKIVVQQTGPEAFRIVLGEATATLSATDLALLATEATRALHPGASSASEFVQRLRGASDVGVQALLRTAAEDDVLVLLKLCEKDRALTDLLLRNMSDRSRTLFLEDLTFKFRDQGPSASAATAALVRLARTVRTLEEQGIEFQAG